jgi:serine phosphatase RsbU (regulator of sigma subunit)
MKSEVGLGVDRFPRSEAICETILHGERHLVVPDATQDDRFARLPGVAGAPHVRAYAGAPIVDGDGIAVGTFCVVDTRARTFTRAEIDLLAELTSWAREEMINSADVARARAVQHLLLPSELPALPGYRFAAECMPTQVVGGDLYDAAPVADGVGFVLADVMGKGTAAAILSATVRAAVRGAFRSTLSRQQQGTAFAGADVVGDVLSDAGRALERDLDRTGTLVTAFLAYIDQSEHTLSWADAGHGLALIASSNGAVRWLESTDLPFGVTTDVQLVARTTSLAPGDRLVVFSDGLFDLFGDTPKQHREGIEALVRDADGPGGLVDRVRARMGQAVATDDVTVFAAERSP